MYYSLYQFWSLVTGISKFIIFLENDIHVNSNVSSLDGKPQDKHIYSHKKIFTPIFSPKIMVFRSFNDLMAVENSSDNPNPL